MAGGSKSSNAPKSRKRVEAETPDSSSSAVLKRAKNGSGFTRCEDCNKDVAMALIDFHSCSLDAKIKMYLEAQAVEIVPKKPSVASEKRKAPKSSTINGKTKTKKVKNANGRKRPLTAFFVFMDDFRKSFKAENPDCKSVATVAKEGGEKWKSLSDEEKKMYVDRAAELKAEYEKACNDDENEKDEGENAVEIVEVKDEEIEGDDFDEENEKVEGEVAEIDEVKKEKIEEDDDDDE